MDDREELVAFRRQQRRRAVELPRGQFPDVLGPTRTRVLLEVMWQPRPTFRSVAAAAGIRLGSVTRHLDELRAAGLVDWQPRRQYTLRALIQEVPLAHASR